MYRETQTAQRNRHKISVCIEWEMESYDKVVRM